ncbi:hypothetical protein BCR34DRAFT_173909 [Clohesyomyces aquaticus]|uniref:Uncharacterized protein n=1 Tax=Clohesyomyces aquaticus TaxID=1231657 RepID=A0A1Y1YGH7_9PLEO|nr:hypothetical protein BCR34DRAFT_173909 [Clohesyomyces aquaticus]
MFSGGLVALVVGIFWLPRFCSQLGFTTNTWTFRIRCLGIARCKRAPTIRKYWKGTLGAHFSLDYLGTESAFEYSGRGIFNWLGDCELPNSIIFINSSPNQVLSKSVHTKRHLDRIHVLASLLAQAFDVFDQKPEVD